MVNIGIDAFGGDNGEKEVVVAAVNAIKTNNDICVFIFGDQNNIKSILFDLKFSENKRLNIVDSSERIEMNDHPVFALRNKTKSSIVIAGNYLKEKKIDAFISAGNTGALVALAQLYIKSLPGILRPVIGAIVPTKNNPMLLIDSGCNVDSKPEWLYQYAIIGNVYYKEMLSNNNPRIGLLSVGTEENKGNALTLSTYKLLIENKSLNFIGNVEARDIPNGICDILVCDGFSGNVFLKTYEGTAKMLFTIIKESLLSSFISKIAAILIKSSFKKIINKFDAKIYGGAPILGANNLILKCHGNAKSTEYIYAFKQCYELINKDIISKLVKEVGA